MEYLRPSIAIGQWGPKNGGFDGPYGFPFYDNPSHWKYSRTKWIRTWVSWPFLQPNAPSGSYDPSQDWSTPIPGWSGMTPGAYVHHLDLQIQNARAAGLQVVLTFRDFPAWSNGAVRSYGDRPDPSVYYRPDFWAPPDDCSINGRWAAMLHWLCARYNRYNSTAAANNRYVDFIEICNEPNLEWWPQIFNKGPWAGAPARVLYYYVAQMIYSAYQITATMGSEPIILAPAMLDATGNSTATTSYQDMTNSLLSQLQQWQWFGNAGFAWSQHNYADWTHGLYGTSNRAGWTHRRLKTHGSGMRTWPSADAATPRVLLTEGGVRLRHTPAYSEEDQRAKTEYAWGRVQRPTTTENPGISMFTQYLMYSDPGFDTGMRTPLAEGGMPRKLYDASTYGQQYWRTFTTTAPRD